MVQPELSRMLSAQEASELSPLPISDVETPTTSLHASSSASTASLHHPGDEAAAEDTGEDPLPDITSSREGA